MPESLKVSSGLRPCFTFSQILNCLVCPLWKCDCVDLLCRSWTWTRFIHVLNSGASSCLSSIVCSGRACGFLNLHTDKLTAVIDHKLMSRFRWLSFYHGMKVMEGLLPPVSVWQSESRQIIEFIFQVPYLKRYSDWLIAVSHYEAVKFKFGPHKPIIWS